MRWTELTLINCLGHRQRSPVGRLAGWRLHRERHDALGDLRGERRDARWPCLVAQQPVHALLHEALLPAPDGSFGDTGLSHDLSRAAAFAAQQHDPSPPGVLLRTVAIDCDRSKPLAVGGGDIDSDTGAHAQGLARRAEP